ncbi:hypothetical protein IFJ82_03600 [Novacetimonas hansenii]|uniref:hypothetical protein n=1 Tax=Novacetimonas hansenii TaxID=436 RepID=UPI0017837C7C|nr:hypothetical protein [Novacetimonas hansenii]QOF95747.1 hypothetical protein IFJ82_03600 [Novacetimonas hansenii]
MKRRARTLSLKKDSARAFSSLIKNRKSFWVPPFDRKRRCLLKLLEKASPKNLYNFRMLSSLTFQAVSWRIKACRLKQHMFLGRLFSKALPGHAVHKKILVAGFTINPATR